MFLGFPGGSAGKESACNVGDLGLIPGLGRSPEEGKGYPLQCSGLENSMETIVHGVTKSRTRLSDFHFHNSIAMNKASGGDGIPVELFQILKDDSVKVLHSIWKYEQIWKTQ